jgi:hypothetical protein
MIISIPEDATTQGLSQQSDTQSQTSDSQSQSCDTGSQQSDSQSQPSDSQSQSCDLWKTPEPLQDGDCRSPANVPNKQTDPLKKQTNKQEPTPHPVCSGIDREGLGTNDPESRNFVQTADISDLVQRIRTAGVEPNKTLLKTLVMVKQREGFRRRPHCGKRPECPAGTAEPQHRTEPRGFSDPPWSTNTPLTEQRRMPENTGRPQRPPSRRRPGGGRHQSSDQSGGPGLCPGQASGPMECRLA